MSSEGVNLENPSELRSAAAPTITLEKSPKNINKPLKKHMTYNLSESTNANSNAAENGNGSESPHHQHILNRTNSLLVAEELLNEINHASLIHKHNMSYNDNMNISSIGNDKSIIDTTPKFSTTLDPHYNQHAHASQFLNTHMHSQIAATSGAETTGHLHRTREVENIAELEPNESVDIETESDEDIILKKATATAAAASASATETTTTTTTIKEPPVGDDLIEAGLEMLHGKGAHLKRTHEVENLNEMSQDDQELN